MEYHSLNKKAIRCMRTTSIIVSAVFIAICLIAVVIILSSKVIIPFFVYIIMAVLFVMMIIYNLVTPVIRYKRYKYYIDDEMLVVVEGLWFINKSIAPIERIHQIAVSSGPIDRVFGLSKVNATTAGGDVVIRFLENDIAQEIADKLKNRINHIVKEQEVKDIG